jgi:cytochrome c-type biogenesis protein CcmH/NrfG
MKYRIHSLLIIMTVLVLVSCAGPKEKTSEEMGTTQDAGRAVATLLAQVSRRETKSQWEQAAALLERALRIEPRNAHLWHRLAKIRLQQGRYGMAESLAQKSSTLARGDAELKQRNAEIINAARQAYSLGNIQDG